MGSRGELGTRGQGDKKRELVTSLLLLLVLFLMPYALCPMPYAPCPMLYSAAEEVKDIVSHKTI